MSLPGPREWCLYHQTTSGTWALSQLTGLRGGQLLAAAPRAGPWGSAGPEQGKQLASPALQAALERNRGLPSPLLSGWLSRQL